MQASFTTDQLIVFALLAVVFVLLIWGRWRYDVVAFGALVVAVIADVVCVGTSKGAGGRQLAGCNLLGVARRESAPAYAASSSASARSSRAPSPRQALPCMHASVCGPVEASRSSSARAFLVCEK